MPGRIWLPPTPPHPTSTDRLPCPPPPTPPPPPPGEWVQEALAALGGKGGGKPTTAQGMGPNVEALPQALEAAKQLAALKL